MHVKLSTELQEHILDRISWMFSDFHLFDSLVRSKLQQAIQDSAAIDINHLTVRKSVERYFDLHALKSSEHKHLIKQIKTIFMATYVLILTYHDKVKKNKLMETVEELVDEYPQFRDIPVSELKLLLMFRNMLAVTVLVVPPYRNRDRIWEIASRLEGSRNEYVRGSGQRKQVDWRMEIFSKEGGEPEKRPWQQGKRASKLKIETDGTVTGTAASAGDDTFVSTSVEASSSSSFASGSASTGDQVNQIHLLSGLLPHNIPTTTPATSSTLATTVATAATATGGMPTSAIGSSTLSSSVVASMTVPKVEETLVPLDQVYFSQLQQPHVAHAQKRQRILPGVEHFSSSSSSSNSNNNSRDLKLPTTAAAIGAIGAGATVGSNGSTIDDISTAAQSLCYLSKGSRSSLV